MKIVYVSYVVSLVFSFSLELLLCWLNPLLKAGVGWLLCYVGRSSVVAEEA